MLFEAREVDGSDHNAQRSRAFQGIVATLLRPVAVVLVVFRS